MIENKTVDNLAFQLGKFEDASSELPPIENWNPELSGNMDMVIRADGHWFHEGEIIEREKLSRLFSSILKKEEGKYYLVTPVEKWEITVEDQPFVIVLASKNEHGAIRMITNMGDEITLSKQNYISLDEHEAPKVLVRNNLYARLNRPVYYQLADMAIEKGGEFFITSQGEELRVG